MWFPKERIEEEVTVDALLCYSPLLPASVTVDTLLHYTLLLPASVTVDALFC